MKTHSEVKNIVEYLLDRKNHPLKQFNINNIEPPPKFYNLCIKKLIHKSYYTLYNNLVLNTVHEYYDAVGLKLFWIKLLSLINKRANFKTINNYLQPYRRSCLVEYISLNRKVDSIQDIKDCQLKFAKIFTYLCDLGVVKGLLCKPSGIPLVIDSKCTFFMFVATTLNMDQLNNIIGFKCFSREDEYIDDFNWELVNKLESRNEMLLNFLKYCKKQ